jgi:hypothetical protein
MTSIAETEGSERVPTYRTRDDLFAREGTQAMDTELLDLAISAAGGRELWDRVSGLKADVSINGPVWGQKGWPPGTSFDQVLVVDTAREHIVFTPFTSPE